MNLKTSITLTIAFLLSGNSYTQDHTNELSLTHKRVLESQSFKSKILNEEVRYTIYLPPDYYTNMRRYPVVYLLHGYTDDETAWIQFGEANITADQAIVNRQIPPMIIVMPDAKLTWYINDYEMKYPYEDMFIKELIPYIDATYRTRPKKEYRGISGLSMGGYGSLMYSMRYPDLFVACAAFSAAVHTDGEMIKNDDWYNTKLAGLIGKNLKGHDRLTDHWRDHNPLDMVKNKSVDELQKVRYYIDCGDDDFLFRGNAALHVIMREREIPHEFRIRDGEHSWIYWRTGLLEGLKFIGGNFNR